MLLFSLRLHSQSQIATHRDILVHSGPGSYTFILRLEFLSPATLLQELQHQSSAPLVLGVALPHFLCEMFQANIKQC